MLAEEHKPVTLDIVVKALASSLTIINGGTGRYCSSAIFMLSNISTVIPCDQNRETLPSAAEK